MTWNPHPVRMAVQFHIGSLQDTTNVTLPATLLFEAACKAYGRETTGGYKEFELRLGATLSLLVPQTMS